MIFNNRFISIRNPLARKPESLSTPLYFPENQTCKKEKKNIKQMFAIFINKKTLFVFAVKTMHESPSISQQYLFFRQ